MLKTIFMNKWVVIAVCAISTIGFIYGAYKTALTQCFKLEKSIKQILSGGFLCHKCRPP